MAKKINWRPTKWETPRWTIDWQSGKCCWVTDNWSGWGPVPYKRFPSIKKAMAHVSRRSKVEPKPLRFVGRVGDVKLMIKKEGRLWYVHCSVDGAAFTGFTKKLEAAKASAEAAAVVLAAHKFTPRV